MVIGIAVGAGIHGYVPEGFLASIMRSVVCAQCHVTYNIRKNAQMQSVGILFPWQGSKWGGITIENIIKKIRSDDALKEWKQTVTGFKLGYIRHPEFEMFSNNSVHWKAGVACADCHMPYTRIGLHKVSDHRVMGRPAGDIGIAYPFHGRSQFLFLPFFRLDPQPFGNIPGEDEAARFPLVLERGGHGLHGDACAVPAQIDDRNGRQEDMPSCSADWGSWMRISPPAACRSRRPLEPSEPAPDRMIPTPPGPWSRARETRNRSMGRCTMLVSLGVRMSWPPSIVSS